MRQPAWSTVTIGAAMALLVSACVDDAPVEGSEMDHSEDGPADDEQTEADDHDADETGADEAAADASLDVDAACAQIGDGFVARASGLDAGVDYAVTIDPRHSDQLESGVMGTADEHGTLTAPASLPDDAGVRAGEYTLEFTEFEQDRTLATASLTIAAECG